MSRLPESENEKVMEHTSDENDETQDISHNTFQIDVLNSSRFDPHTRLKTVPPLRQKHSTNQNIKYKTYI